MDGVTLILDVQHSQKFSAALALLTPLNSLLGKGNLLHRQYVVVTKIAYSNIIGRRRDNTSVISSGL
jgi:hypothetical protein